MCPVKDLLAKGIHEIGHIPLSGALFGTAVPVMNNTVAEANAGATGTIHMYIK